MAIEDRKNAHIHANLNEDVAYRDVRTGFDEITFVHNALPSISFEDVDTTTRFLNWNLRVPFLLSSMIGGTDEAHRLLTNLAMASSEIGSAIGLGSQRIAIEQPERRRFFEIRNIAHNVPIFANIGAIQLNKNVTASDCKRLIDSTEADALILHLNPLQEVLQSGGDTQFAGLESQIEELVNEMEVPVIVKEVGFGISADVARRLADLGVHAIDVAGAGGTSWSAVEGQLATDPIKGAMAGIFREWGIPTVESLKQVRVAVPDVPVIASGGIRHGLDAAKAIRLGASMVGFGGSALRAAAEGPEAIVEFLELARETLRAAMFATGSSDITVLRSAPLSE